MESRHDAHISRATTRGELKRSQCIKTPTGGCTKNEHACRPHSFLVFDSILMVWFSVDNPHENSTLLCFTISEISLSSEIIAAFSKQRLKTHPNVVGQSILITTLPK